ncbi:hypothetical protein TNCV_5136321 [Trichonephila clavipes]|nr:hypothetical protein TNCV_5136321 [Trichonephila clavipes]
MALSRFLSGHIKTLTFQQGRKIFLEADQGSPGHTLNCLNFTVDEVLKNPIILFGFFSDFWFYAACVAFPDKKQQQQE